jgi:hypothetical protein
MNQVTSGVGQAVHFVHTATGITLDVMVLAVMFAALAAYGFYFGKRRLVAFVLSFYPAFLLYAAFPYIGQLTFLHSSGGQIVLSKLVIFAVFFVVCHIALLNVLHGAGDFSFSKREKIFQISVLSVSALVLILIFMHQYVPFAGVYTFSAGIGKLFVSRTAQFWLLLAPLAGVYVSTR